MKLRTPHKNPEQKSSALHSNTGHSAKPYRCTNQSDDEKYDSVIEQVIHLAFLCGARRSYHSMSLTNN
jgi:hypothetical protein